MDKYCGNCGSKIVNKKCPKCDKKEIVVKKEETTAKTNGFAIAGFVISVFSILFCFISAIGLVFSIIGLVKTNTKKEAGMGLAISGTIISGLMLLVSIIFFWVFYIFVMASILR